MAESFQHVCRIWTFSACDWVFFCMQLNCKQEVPVTCRKNSHYVKSRNFCMLSSFTHLILLNFKGENNQCEFSSLLLHFYMYKHMIVTNITVPSNLCQRGSWTSSLLSQWVVINPLFMNRKHKHTWTTYRGILRVVISTTSICLGL